MQRRAVPYDVFGQLERMRRLKAGKDSGGGCAKKRNLSCLGAREAIPKSYWTLSPIGTNPLRHLKRQPGLETYQNKNAVEFEAQVQVVAGQRGSDGQKGVNVIDAELQAMTH